MGKRKMASTTTSTSNSKSRLDRIHHKFKAKVDGGNFYEASHMIKTLFHRYKSQKKNEDAENVLYESIITFLQHDQNESAYELGKLLIELYQSIDHDIETGIGKILEIVKKSTEGSPSRADFIESALSWTTKDHKHGHVRLHEAVAQKYWEEKNYSSARQHIIHTTNGSLCASFLIEYHIVVGFPGEIDLFVTQAVLQFLCLRKILIANATFSNYTAKHPGIKRQSHPFNQPLLNFIAFLLLAVEKGNIEQFSLLCEKYQPSIHRDPTYSAYLDKIGQLFFGLPPPQRSGMDGMIGNLMESLFTGPGSEAITEGEDIVMETEDID